MAVSGHFRKNSFHCVTMIVYRHIGRTLRRMKILTLKTLIFGPFFNPKRVRKCKTSEFLPFAQNFVTIKNLVGRHIGVTFRCMLIKAP